MDIASLMFDFLRLTNFSEMVYNFDVSIMVEPHSCFQ